MLNETTGVLAMIRLVPNREHPRRIGSGRESRDVMRKEAGVQLLNEYEIMPKDWYEERVDGGRRCFKSRMSCAEDRDARVRL